MTDFAKIFGAKPITWLTFLKLKMNGDHEVRRGVMRTLSQQLINAATPVLRRNLINAHFSEVTSDPPSGKAYRTILCGKPAHALGFWPAFPAIERKTEVLNEYLNNMVAADTPLEREKIARLYWENLI